MAYFLLSGHVGVECEGCGEEQAVHALAAQRVQVELLGRSETVLLGSQVEDAEAAGEALAGLGH